MFSGPWKWNMAQRTGLEPATPGVTGRYSNRLNYRCAVRSSLAFGFLRNLKRQEHLRKWWVMTGSNRRPSACKADALPAELITHVSRCGAHSTGDLQPWQALIAVFLNFDQTSNSRHKKSDPKVAFSVTSGCSVGPGSGIWRSGRDSNPRPPA